MNRLFLLFALFFVLSTIGFSQAPQQISYQGVARNTSGAVLSGVTVAVKFEIRQGSAIGPVIFSEEHQGLSGLTTNSFGLFTTFIGSINNLSTINWSSGPFFIEVSVDASNGTSYSSVGVQQLMSVPYALYAEKSGNAAPTPTININSPNTVTNPSAGNYNITIPSSITYSAGIGIDITGGVITNTATTITPTITGSGIATASTFLPNVYNIDVPTPSLTVTGNTISISSGNSQVLPSYSLTAGNTNILLNELANNYTITPVTPTLNVSGASLSGAYPSQTLTIPSSSTSLVQGNNVSLNQVGNTYTVSSITPTLNVSGASLTGAYPSQTLTIPSSSTSLVQGNNVILNQSGNTYTVSSVTPTLTAGANVTITPVGPSNVYTISSAIQNYIGTAGNISVSGTTFNLIPTSVVTGTYGSSLTNVVPTFSVDNFGRLTAASQYTPGITGDVTGSINTSTVSKLQGVSISTLSPTNGQILQYSGTAWTPTSLSSGWNLTGNGGTTASNFIGTTDNNFLSFKTNGLERANFTTGNNLNLFSGDDVNPGFINMNGNLSNTIKVSEVTGSSLSNGSSLNIAAGNSKTGTANTYGGTLNLIAGASAGNAGSTIDFLTATPGTAGSLRANPSLKMRLTERGQLLIGNITGYAANSKLIVFDGHIESMQATAPAIAGAGSLLGLIGSTAALSAGSTDIKGTIVINIGVLGGAKGNYATVTFDKTYATAPVVILTPKSEGAALLSAYVSGTTATGFTLALSSSTLGLTTYEFNYIVIE